MSKALHEAESEAIRRALAFANLPRVDDADEVYAIFGTGAQRGVFVNERGQPLPIGGVVPLAERGREGARILEKDRDELVDDLDALIKSPSAFRRDEAKRVVKHAQKAFLIGRLDVDERGRVVDRMEVFPGGVEGAYGYALALLMDRSRPWSKMLRRCAWPRCRRFFLAQASEAGGPRRKYCGDACVRAKNTQHVKTWRYRQQRS